MEVDREITESGGRGREKKHRGRERERRKRMEGRKEGGRGDRERQRDLHASMKWVSKDTRTLLPARKPLAP